MNVYDFDKTIYDGDSTVHFVFYLYKHKPKTLLNLPRTLICGLLYGLHIIPKQKFKENLFHMFKYVEDMKGIVDKFTDEKLDNIKEWYKYQQKTDDVVISASPEFLIKRFCDKIGINSVMASPVDIKSGKYYGLNCHGEEKVKRYEEIYAQKQIDEFYSDSYSDTPLAKLANKAFLVRGNTIQNW